MRRLVIACAALLALAAVPAALAATSGSTPAGGTLVVKSADNGDGAGQGARPVAVLVVSGFVIGHVTDQGRIAIYDINPADQSTPEVTGAQQTKDLTLPNGVTGAMWSGSDFSFRAVDGTFRVAIWGSGVYLFANGAGSAILTGQSDPSAVDGVYSLNAGPWASLPVTTKLTLGPPAAAG